MSEHGSASGGQLGARRETAVRALAEVLVAGDQAAARVAVNRAAAAILDAGAAADLDRVALDAARSAAAEHVRIAAPVSGMLGRRIGRCADVPAVLAARQADALPDADHHRLARHLNRCPGCRALQARFARADQAYAEALTTASATPRHDEEVDWLAPVARPVVVVSSAADSRSTGGPVADQPAATSAWLVAVPNAVDPPADAPDAGDEPERLPTGAGESRQAETETETDGSRDVWLPAGVANAVVPRPVVAATAADWLVGAGAAVGAGSDVPERDAWSFATPSQTIEAAAVPAPAPPPRGGRRPAAAHLALPFVLLLGAGGVAAAAGGVLSGSHSAPSQSTTSTSSIAATPAPEPVARPTAAQRAAERRRERAAAHRRAARRRAAAHRRAAARRRATQVVAATPQVAAAPVVVRPRPVVTAAPRPVPTPKRSAPKPAAPKPAPKPVATKPQPTTSGPSGAAPSGGSGRTPNPTP